MNKTLDKQKQHSQDIQLSNLWDVNNSPQRYSSHRTGLIATSTTPLLCIIFHFVCPASRFHQWIMSIFHRFAMACSTLFGFISNVMLQHMLPTISFTIFEGGISAMMSRHQFPRLTQCSYPQESEHAWPLQDSNLDLCSLLLWLY